MNSQRRCVLSLAVLALAAAPARASLLDTVQQLRAGDCGQRDLTARPLRYSKALAGAAEQLADGVTLTEAVARAGYAAASIALLHLQGDMAAMGPALRRNSCRTLTRTELRDVGMFQRGTEFWIVLAEPTRVPTHNDAARLVANAMELINDARLRGAQCGRRAMVPAPAVTHSALLTRAALEHALDMAENGYFEHRDLRGRTPADRVRSTGYQEQVVGENIAYGPSSAREVVQGWLGSPEHCENLMDPRFTEMGIALAPGRANPHGLYWVQVLATPRR
jgi:uncharacterized protein YkwD